MLLKRLSGVLFLVCLMSAPAWGTSYYMRADGTSASKAAASGPCGTQANTMSIATHNGETFNAGDVIVLCDDGGTYRNNMYIPSSGSDGFPITYRAASGDTPVISGFDAYTTGWTLSGGTIYYRAFTQMPGDYEGEKTVVKYGATVLEWKPGDYATLAADEWDFFSGNLYINIGQNPEGETIEATQRNYCIYVDGKSYTSYSDLILEGGTRNFVGTGTTSNTTLTDVETRFFSYHGARFSSGSTYVTLTRVLAHQDIGYDPGADLGWSSAISFSGGNHHTITDTKAYNSRKGLEIGQYAAPSDQSGTVIAGGEYYGNVYDDDDADGIALFGDDQGDNPSPRPIIRDVKAYNNADHGIDMNNGEAWDIYRNEIYGQFGTCTGCGIGNKAGKGNRWYYNIFHDNRSHGFYDTGNGGNEVYNNVSYNNGGFGFHMRDGGGSYILKNNISDNNALGAIKYRDAETPTQDYNLWYPRDYTVIANYDGANYTVWSTYLAATDQDDHSINDDPVFVSTSDFSLQPSSLAIDSGTYVGLTQDYAGNPIVGAPDIGAHEYILRLPLPPHSLTVSDGG